MSLYEPKDRVVVEQAEGAARPSRSVGPSLELLRTSIQASSRDTSDETTIRAAKREDVKDPHRRPTQEEMKRRWREKFAARISETKNEARDPDWAPEAEELFEQDFAAARDKFGAELVDVECRTTRCLANVEWPNYADAHRNFPRVMHSTYAINCAVAIDIGDQPMDPSLPHQGRVVFRCKRGPNEDTTRN